MQFFRLFWSPIITGTENVVRTRNTRLRFTKSAAMMNGAKYREDYILFINGKDGHGQEFFWSRKSVFTDLGLIDP